MQAVTKIKHKLRREIQLYESHSNYINLEEISSDDLIDLSFTACDLRLIDSIYLELVKRYPKLRLKIKLETFSSWLKTNKIEDLKCLINI